MRSLPNLINPVDQAAIFSASLELEENRQLAIETDLNALIISDNIMV
ncbi:MAG: hypothetical protein KME31_05740 [Tolypothrix carrinoi HA7290-LM1]|nr:hypothetical protein [Tolypothrix carrinoi HA7290-LM1]